MSYLHRPASRRLFLASIAQFPAVLLLAAKGQAPEPTASPTCHSPDDNGMRVSSDYVDLSPFGAERDCRNCDSWIAVKSGAACGGCTLISGPISPVGFCDSWALAAGKESPKTPVKS